MERGLGLSDREIDSRPLPESTRRLTCSIHRSSEIDREMRGQKLNRYNIATSIVRARLRGLTDYLYGCSHRRTTFPITLRATVAGDGQPRTEGETYIVCLDCGRHLSYDWAAMRITEQRTTWAGAPGA